MGYCEDNKVDPENRGISALESVALLIDYGFEGLGLRRISCGQHVELKGWQNRLELLGFKLGEYMKENIFMIMLLMRKLYPVSMRILVELKNQKK